MTVGAPTTTELDAIKDSFIASGSAKHINNGANEMLRVRASGSNRSVVAFDLSAFNPAGLLRATLAFEVKNALTNWGSGRLVLAHRLLDPWAEGNGFNAGGNVRGTGDGVTWQCATDTDIENDVADCATAWLGGTFEPSTGPGFTHTSEMTGQVTFDVTQDVLAGAELGWLIKKEDEGQNGTVEYHSRESAIALADPSLAPKLILEFVGITTEPDTVPPTISALVSPAPNAQGWNKSDVTVTFSCFDADSGIATCPSPVSITTEGEDQTVSGTAIDQAGNTATTSVTVNLDKSAPTVDVTSPANGEVVNTDTVDISGSVSEALSGIETASCNGVAAGISGTTFSCNVPIVEGANDVVVVAADRAGNSTTSTLTLGRVLGAEILITSPLNLSALDLDLITVSGTIDDPAAAVIVNGIAATVSGGTFTASNVALHEGVNLVSASATDALGNISVDSVSVFRDSTPPVVSVTSPQDGLITTQSTIAVVGIVNDVGSMIGAGDAVSVQINGTDVSVSNRAFALEGIALALGTNTINVVAQDAAGNVASTTISVEHQDASGQSAILPGTGDGQTGSVLAELPAPLRVSLVDALGAPVVGERVIFKVARSNGTLRTATQSGLRSAAVLTDSNGEAEVFWTLGSRAGVGSDRVEASAVGFAGRTVFIARATPIAADKIHVDTGNNQTGAIGQRLPRPLVAIVTDVGHNRLEGVPVTFTVDEGLGSIDGNTAVTVPTDTEGRAVAVLTLGPEAGPDNHVVTATFEGNLSSPATFVASAKLAGPPSQTKVTGVVLDNTDVPIEGVTLSIEGTALTAVTDVQGQFTIDGAPIGPILLHADGSTSTRPGSWPQLEFELVTVSGIENSIGMPIYLLPLSDTNSVFVSDTEGGTLLMADAPGFSLTVEAGSATFPDGTKSGVISATVVHADKVPMVPNFGQQPRFIVTIQPAGVLFDPPARVTLPNLDGLAPGEITEIYSFAMISGSSRRLLLQRSRRTAQRLFRTQVSGSPRAAGRAVETHKRTETPRIP